jgi:menaquinone-dependent protoporphyrinogen oxidase
MAKILIAYSTTDGHTLKICERLRGALETSGHQVTLRSVTGADTTPIGAFDKIVIGASIRYGKHNPAVAAFIARHLAALEARPSVFFSVNVVARKPEKNSAETNPYVRKFLRGISWRPRHVEVIAGRIDYPSLGFFDRNMIRLIMWMTHGPTDPTGSFEFTDWSQVDALASRIDGM